MAQIYRPQPKQDPLERFLPMAGSLAGNAIAPGAGGAVGGMLGSELQTKPPAATPEVGGGGAFQRRMQELDSDPLSQIRQGIQVAQQQGNTEALKPLLQADYIARNKPA